MQHLTEKGLLKSEATIGLADYVMDTRAEMSAAQVALQQKLQANAEATEFATRELAELTVGVEPDRARRRDRRRPSAGARRARSGSTTWSPPRPGGRSIGFRAGAEKDPVQLEYLAAIEQQTGEDWTGVDMTLSTAQPQLNATPPELLALDITVVGRGQDGRQQPRRRRPAGMMAGGMGGMGGGMGGGMAGTAR